MPSPRPGRIAQKQIRGATYPPLTAPLAATAPAKAAPSANGMSCQTSEPAMASGSPGGCSSSTAPSGGCYVAGSAAAAAPTQQSLEQSRLGKFRDLLSCDIVDLKKLRSISWSGIPLQCRAESWQLLLGYLPPNREWRQSTLSRKRREYCESVPQYFDVADAERTAHQKETLHQIQMDVPRTSTSSPIFHNEVVQRSLERVLYIWSLRHPASGYVQGINDLLTPFFLVFLLEHLPKEVASWDSTDAVAAVESIPPHVFAEVEADSFWCLSKLLDSIQDHYTFAQPGVQRLVFKTKELIARIDGKLHDHLKEQNLQFIQFAFRWMNCLLMRELSIGNILRVWDTYLAEYGGSEDEAHQIGDGFAVLHVYVCAALLTRWSEQLQQMEFQDLVVFLQHLPTSDWTEKEVGELLSQAYVYKTLYHHAQSHLGT